MRRDDIRRRWQLLLRNWYNWEETRGFVCCWLLPLHVGKWLDLYVLRLHLSWWWHGLGSASFSQTRETHESVILQKHVANCLLGIAALMFQGCTVPRKGALIYCGGLATQPQNKTLLQQQSNGNPIILGSKTAAPQLYSILYLATCVVFFPHGDYIPLFKEPAGLMN